MMLFVLFNSMVSHQIISSLTILICTVDFIFFTYILCIFVSDMDFIEHNGELINWYSSVIGWKVNHDGEADPWTHLNTSTVSLKSIRSFAFSP